MCNCRADIEKRLHARATGQIPEGSKDLSVELIGYALIFGGEVSMKNCMPVEVEYQAPVKNKPGQFKAKKEKQNMMGNYCMFCGEKYAVETLH